MWMKSSGVHAASEIRSRPAPAARSFHPAPSATQAAATARAILWPSHGTTRGLPEAVARQIAADDLRKLDDIAVAQLVAEDEL